MTEDAHILVARQRRIREALAAMACGDEASLTDAERRTAQVGAALAHDDPGTLAQLRHSGRELGGALASDYVTPSAELVARLDKDVKRLLQRGDRSLWVDEPDALGGFALSGKGARYNEDTLRFYRALSLLGDAALIPEFRPGSTRRTVWEPGGGWGGFGYHFKSACPNATYLITGHPPALFLPAMYLATALPDSRLRFFDPADPQAFWREWDDVDFAFAPEDVALGSRLEAVRLLVDFGAMARMSAGRLARHVRHAWTQGCRYLFTEPPPGELVAQCYWRHPVAAPGYVRKRLSLTGGGSATPGYFLGWRRLHP